MVNTGIPASLHASIEDTIASESQVSIIIASGCLVIRFSTSFIWIVGSSCASVIYSSIPCSSAAFCTPSLTSTKKGFVWVFMARPITYFFPLSCPASAFSSALVSSPCASSALVSSPAGAASVCAAVVAGAGSEPELHPANIVHTIAIANTVAPIRFFIIHSPLLKKY